MTDDDARPGLTTTAYLILTTLYRHRNAGHDEGLRLSPDGGAPGQTTFWALQNLTRMGLISSYPREVDGVQRRFYTLTEDGYNRIQAELNPQ